MYRPEQKERSEHEESARYRLVREVGRGAMGVVWLAYDRIREEHVALKRVRVPSTDALLRLKREFRVMAPLRHPHLARLYELGSDERGAFFTMEYVEGHDLRQLLEQGLAARHASDRLGFARDIGRQLLRVLATLHERGIVHRDLKPSNLMLDGKGVLKLIDFGLLAAPGEEPITSLDRRPAGTPPYAAPEQARGEWATPAADIYSVGVLLLRMAVGRLPAARGIDSDLTDLPRPLEVVCGELPGDFASLCGALVQDDPRRRPDALSALAALGPACVVPFRRAISPAGAPGPHESAGAEVKAWLADWRERVGDGLFQAAVVEGPSASGKTALLRWMHDFARDVGGLVLQGGERPCEYVPYNVLDAAIDALAAALLETPMDAELASDVAQASQAFPVLAGERVPDRCPTTAKRAEAFDAVIRILESLAGTAGVYLVIDDLHRADEESLAFVDRLLERQPVAVGLLATVRADGGKTVLEPWLAARKSIARRSLTPAARTRSAPSRTLSPARGEGAPTIR